MDDDFKCISDQHSKKKLFISFIYINILRFNFSILNSILFLLLLNNIYQWGVRTVNQHKPLASNNLIMYILSY
jgi:hypothetical protein